MRQAQIPPVSVQDPPVEMMVEDYGFLMCLLSTAYVALNEAGRIVARLNVGRLAEHRDFFVSTATTLRSDVGPLRTLVMRCFGEDFDNEEAERDMMQDEKRYFWIEREIRKYLDQDEA